MKYGKPLRQGIYLSALFLFTMIVSACNPSLTSSSSGNVMLTSTAAAPSLTPLAAPTERSTAQLAADYLSAVANSDRTALRSLIGADAWCSTPDSSDVVKRHLEEFGSTQMRNIKIEELDIKGWVAYPPGSEAARISFEYRRTNNGGWTPAGMVVVTVPSPDTKTRFICNITD